MGRINTIGNEDDEDWEFDSEEKEELGYFGKTRHMDSDYEDDECECDYEEPKNKHGVSILMNVNSNDAGVIRDALTKAGHVKLADDFETRRELGIMHELKEKGWGIFESWAKDNYGGKQKRPKYKMKHKVLSDGFKV